MWSKADMQSNATATRTAESADVIVVGDGVIGLSIAFELGRAKVSCVLVGCEQQGTASGAAAGLLAPSVGHLLEAARPFFSESLRRYPEFIRNLREFAPHLSIVEGLVDVSANAADTANTSGSRLLSADQLAELEPTLEAPADARFYPDDGAVDNVKLMSALRLATGWLPSVSVVHGRRVATIDLSRTDAAVVLDDGDRIHARSIVLAAGAWSTQIDGLPRTLPVFPLKGQMLAVGSTVLRHAVMSDDIYLVPRDSEIAIGATAERAGFDVATNPDAIERMRLAAVAICPALERAPVLRAWAGIRPATPDMLPIIGADPGDERLIYACGHSKNGILLAPATALAVSALVQRRVPLGDLAPFSIARFGVN
jgi:glycine/D-amino acid oxidase-like deaminating enzyme